jgi:hypothetical protein
LAANGDKVEPASHQVNGFRGSRQRKGPFDDSGLNVLKSHAFSRDKA